MEVNYRGGCSEQDDLLIVVKRELFFAQCFRGYLSREITIKSTGWIGKTYCGSREMNYYWMDEKKNCREIVENRLASLQHFHFS